MINSLFTRGITKRCLLLPVLWVAVAGPACGITIAGENHLYGTGPLVEIDRCGSAWLIKRFVDVKAVFHFYPEGAFITEGIPFDTPDARLRRTHRLSTFEVLMREYDLKDKRLQSIAATIHAIEINAWQKRSEYRDILYQISKVTDNAKTDTERLNGCLDFFDQLMQSKGQ